MGNAKAFEHVNHKSEEGFELIVSYLFHKSPVCLISTLSCFPPGQDPSDSVMHLRSRL
jgi:hypothetical protein